MQMGSFTVHASVISDRIVVIRLTDMIFESVMPFFILLGQPLGVHSYWIILKQQVL